MPTVLPHFDGPALEAALDLATLVETLEKAFLRPCCAPPRTRLELAAGRVILMPAWRNERFFGVKISTVFPENPAVGRPAVGGTYCLFDARYGTPLATMDGRMLTLLRTAAASALAADRLARGDASSLTLVGAGALAPYLARAHALVRPYRKIRCWGRRPERAIETARLLARHGLPAEHGPRLEEAVAVSDVISAATFSRESLVLGRWVRPGTHLDLVGAFTPLMRESDAELVARSRVFVDTREGAAEEAGDLIQAASEGRFSMERITGDLHELVAGTIEGRRGADEITLFKSVGTGIEDLAAAELAYDRLTRS